MVIVNESEFDLECIINNITVQVGKKQTVEIGYAKYIELKHMITSFVCWNSENSKIIKALSLIDDPFKTKKDYHIVVDSSFDISSCDKDDILTVQHLSIFADVKLQVYYNFFTLQNHGKSFMPSDVAVNDKSNIGQLFERYHKRTKKWDAVWNVFVEPLLLEIVGYAAIYWFFSFSIGRKAWWIIGILATINVLIEVVLFRIKFDKNKSGDTIQFHSLLAESDILSRCYLNKG